MRTAQVGDRVLVHYVKRLQDGSVASSRGRGPLEVTVGVNHPRLPGLGAALVGLAPGASASVNVPAGLAYGPVNPARVRRWPLKRFPASAPLLIDRWVRALSRRGGSRLVRVLEVRDDGVTVDTNHRGAGQAMELRVKLVSIQAAEVGPDARAT